MPDNEKKTVSASQIAALFNVSPYVTKWMLWQHFANGVPLPPVGNERVDWGNRLQTPILEAAADELRLEVVENKDDDYTRHDKYPLGATEDGECICPSRGLGIVEAKNVDWQVWKKTWSETAAPRHIEVQLQQQMMVKKASWGVIACLVGGNELYLYQREPIPELWESLASASTQFFDDIKAGNEPDAFGDADELPMINFLYPESDPTIVKDLAQDIIFMQDVVEWENAKSTASIATKTAKNLQAKILAKTENAGIVNAAGGAILYIKKTTVPDSMLNLDLNYQKAILSVDPEFAGIVTRKGHTRTTINVKSCEKKGGDANPEYWNI